MTPNLKRLFEEARADIPTDCAGSEYNLMARKRDLADHAVRRILWDHGEALIEALGKLANEASGFNGIVGPDVVGHTNKRVLQERIDTARQLLAQLESEAQP